MTKWIRIPEPGDFCGEGRWVVVSGEIMERAFEDCKRTAYLPTAWTVDDHKPVHEKGRPDVHPNWVIDDGVLIHQFHKIAVPVYGDDAKSYQHSQQQLLNLLKTKLEVEHVEEEG